jgi:1-acyl-sn-glycerol-3-phosphate acyltransferase
MAYAVARFVCWVIFKALFRLKVVGSENLPRSGALIVASNHVSYFDPPLVGVGAPRPLNYMAKEELFHIPVLAPLIKLLNAFPVDRGKGDVSAIRRALAILGRGEALLIFPEGGRNRTGEAPGQLGTALLVARSGAPVIPAFVDGSAHPRLFSRITVSYGKPMHFETSKKASRDDLAKWTDAIMHGIFALKGSG